MLLRITIAIAYLLCSFFPINSYSQDTNFISFGAEWKYLDDGSNQGTNWRNPDFDDSTWASGPAQLGYGDGDENTILSYGNNSNNKYLTTYFRHHFNIDDVSPYINFIVKLIRDDGAIVYVNGQEVMRSNFGTNTYQYNDEAYGAVSSSGENIIYEEVVPTSYFQNNNNVIAVEVHQSSPSSSDISFDFELVGLDDTPAIYREPYLQVATSNSIVIKWATDIPTSSKVSYESPADNTPYIATDDVLKTDHEIKLTNLLPDTRYYYSVGTIEEKLSGGTFDHYFYTNPIPGTQKDTRIWVVGDSGTGSYHQRDVRDSYLNFTGSAKADLLLMLGDNSYNHGRQAEYHVGVFKNMYENILRNTTLWPTPGNHDYYSAADATSETGPYFENFVLPKNGEAGGLASNTEAYYSFDYGNIHFISLDSYDTDRDSSGVMGQWLIEDLENTDADWLIAYWHYPPYSKGNHDSDDPSDHSGRCIDMRENFLPILERYGVDLVLSGHSHVYERSFLINGHYGYSNTFNAQMLLDGGSGRMDETGAYTKPDNMAPNAGTVYAVCGVSGKRSSLQGHHPIMFMDTDDHYGSMIIDIVSDTLEAKFLNEDGIIIDYFHIEKTDLLNTIQTNIDSDVKVTLFPNPSQSILNINYQSANIVTKSVYAELFSATGGKILTKKMSSTKDGEYNLSCSVGNLPLGIYTVKIRSDKNLLVSKLFVKSL